jgi:hypothetical protein
LKRLAHIVSECESSLNNSDYFRKESQVLKVHSEIKKTVRAVDSILDGVDMLTDTHSNIDYSSVLLIQNVGDLYNKKNFKKEETYKNFSEDYKIRCRKNYKKYYYVDRFEKMNRKKQEIKIIRKLFNFMPSELLEELI